MYIYMYMYMYMCMYIYDIYIYIYKLICIYVHARKDMPKTYLFKILLASYVVPLKSAWRVWCYKWVHAEESWGVVLSVVLPLHLPPCLCFVLSLARIHPPDPTHILSLPFPYSSWQIRLQNIHTYIRYICIERIPHTFLYIYMYLASEFAIKSEIETLLHIFSYICTFGKRICQHEWDRKTPTHTFL